MSPISEPAGDGLASGPATSAANVWDQRYDAGGNRVTEIGVVGDPFDYTSYPFMWKHSIARRLTGSVDGDPNMEIAKLFMSPSKKKMLAIGSGLASTEEWYVSCGFVEECIAYETSAVAAQKARARISAAGLSERLDIRAGSIIGAGIPDGEYDVILVQAAIHHFFEIEMMFMEMHRLLKPGGILIYDEYVGPDHLIFSDDQYSLMDEINSCLDPRYRIDIRTGAVRERVDRPSLDQMLDFDPSEGVHASMILPLTYKYFDVEYRRDYGGLIMRPFFTGILQNFDLDSSPCDQSVARLIILIEELLHRYRVIPTGHARIVACRRDVPRESFCADEKVRMHYANWSPC